MRTFNEKYDDTRWIKKRRLQEEHSIRDDIGLGYTPRFAIEFSYKDEQKFSITDKSDGTVIEGSYQEFIDLVELMCEWKSLQTARKRK